MAQLQVSPCQILISPSAKRTDINIVATTLCYISGFKETEFVCFTDLLLPMTPYKETSMSILLNTVCGNRSALAAECGKGAFNFPRYVY